MFCNYSSILELPNHSSITTFLAHYGSYRTVAPFDLPTQNTISMIIIFCMYLRICIKFDCKWKYIPFKCEFVLCVCARMCPCVCVWVCTCVHVHVCMHMCLHVCLHVCVCVCMCACVCACVRACVCTPYIIGKFGG